MVNIAIDARPLANPVDGIARYTREIVTRLLPRGEHRWHLYSHRPIKLASNAALIRTPSRGLGNSLLTSQCLYPQWQKEDSIEVFWSPRHHLPYSSVPAVVTIHDLCWLKQPQSMPLTRRLTERNLMPRALRQAAAIAAVSQSTANDIIAQWPNLADKVSVIHPGKTDFKEGAVGPPDKPYIVCVATVEPRKNHKLLLEAFAQIKHKVPHLLVCIGRQGWGDTRFPDLIERYNLSDRVVWRSHADDDELASYYRGAEFLVTPSIYEGFNLPILEAITCGTPVLASDLAVHREVAGACGAYFELNANALAQALLELMTDTNTRHALRDACTTTSEHFSWDRAAQQVLDKLLSLAA